MALCGGVKAKPFAARVSAVSAVCALALIAVTGWAAYEYRRNGRGKCSHNGYDMSGIASFAAGGWAVTPCGGADPQCARYDDDDLRGANTCVVGPVRVRAPAFSPVLTPGGSANDSDSAGGSVDPRQQWPVRLSSAGDFDLMTCQQRDVPCQPAAGDYVAVLRGGEPCVWRDGSAALSWRTELTVACPRGYSSDAPPRADPTVVLPPGATEYVPSAFSLDARTCTARLLVLHDSACQRPKDMRTKWVALMACALPVALALLLVAWRTARGRWCGPWGGLALVTAEARDAKSVAMSTAVAATATGTGTGSTGTASAGTASAATATAAAAASAPQHPPQQQQQPPSQPHVHGGAASSAAAATDTDAASAGAGADTAAAAVTGAASAPDAVVVVVT